LANLFTFILEYDGGTYIAQAAGKDAATAANVWLGALSSTDLEKWSLSRSDLQHSLNNGFVALDGLQNVWCTSASASKGLALVNAVATEAKLKQ
jgi:hypothetical protein